VNTSQLLKPLPSSKAAPSIYEEKMEKISSMETTK